MTDLELADINKRIDELLDAAGRCIIPDEQFDELFGLYMGLYRVLPEEEYASLTSRLDLAVSSYCHILRIGCDMKDETVDLQTALRLNARLKAGEPLSNEEIRLLGKRGIDWAADQELFLAFLGVIHVIPGKPLPPQTAESVQVVPVHYYTLLSDEQFEILANSVFEQVVVRSTLEVTDKGLFGRGAAESPALQTRFQLAYMIGLLNEQIRGILPQPNLTAAERQAESAYVDDLCRRAADPDQLTPEECDYIVNHRPTSQALKDRLFAKILCLDDAALKIFSRAGPGCNHY